MCISVDFDWGSEASTVGLTFRLCGGERVTLLASTKANTGTNSRYRIQSDSIAAIHLVFRDFLDRLQRKYGREVGSFIITLPDTEIPLINEYFQELDDHILRRRRDAQIKVRFIVYNTDVETDGQTEIRIIKCSFKLCPSVCLLNSRTILET